MKKRGKGMAVMWYPVGTGGTNVSTARLEMNRNGVLTVFIGSPDVGQGSRDGATVMLPRRPPIPPAGAAALTRRSRKQKG